MRLLRFVRNDEKTLHLNKVLILFLPFLLLKSSKFTLLRFKVKNTRFLQNLRDFKMTQRDLAGRLDINVKTLRKWKKDCPKVCELLMIGLKAESMIDSLKENCCELEQLIQNKNAIKSEIECPKNHK